jgi:uncharacterized protein (TIGR03435 family)
MAIMRATPIAFALISVGLPAMQLWAQTFDVVSIKPNQSGGSGTHMEHGSFRATNVTARRLLRSAFGVMDHQIVGGPGWIDDDKYDVTAKIDALHDLTAEEFEPYLQKLLADRFQLRFHRQVKELPGYSLVVAKSGPKLTPHVGEGHQDSNTTYDAGLTTLLLTKSPLSYLTAMLSRNLGQTVVDQTGIPGEFDFKIEWSKDQNPDLGGPTLFTALQEQLGLRLESKKVPVDVIVIDRLEKPSDN